ncbi:hypothetical protein F4861DRAFT_510473 [Xylaria intraflava]|nr:hypothetical protein F4861DRAFT_510473 [Xylaria intraflava]
MDTGGLAQMSYSDFTSPTGMAMPSAGLASRRGGQNIKPLSFDAIKSSANVKDNGVPTPRTSRGHLLAGLRTAPKSATATTFAGAGMSSHAFGRNNDVSENMYGGYAPKTSLPRISTQQGAYNATGLPGMGQQHYTPEQILAPPEFHLDEQVQDQMDPGLYAQLVTANLYLAQQKQRLQQQLLNVQAAAQQFQGLNLNGQQAMQHQALQHQALQQQVTLQSLYQQQQQLQAMQQSMSPTVPVQQNLFTYYDPTTQITYLVDPTTGQMQPSFYENQPSTPQSAYFQQPNHGAPRVQVSPPPAENNPPAQRTITPPKKLQVTVEPTPLPPPSANAFRRGHKKSPSSANVNKGLTISSDEALASAGPKTAPLPLSPLTNGGYGPGQARAGEHPIRQPRGPPALDELFAKPTAKHEGSKNFVARTRKSAVHNLMKAGLERRKGTGSSVGSMSPVSETTAETGAVFADNESDSGRSGSGSLSGDAEPSLASSRTSASGSWGAIGSDRPGSRQKSRRSVDSQASTSESDNSFASVFKHGSQRQAKADGQAGQRKAPRLVLTSAEKRKGGITVA